MTPHTRARGRGQLLLFAAVYLLYLAGRWATGSDMSGGPASVTDHDLGRLSVVRPTLAI